MARQLWGAFRPPVSWYPGHMAKASRQVKERVSRCDIVLEVFKDTCIKKNYEKRLPSFATY